MMLERVAKTAGGYEMGNQYQNAILHGKTGGSAERSGGPQAIMFTIGLIGSWARRCSISKKATR